MLNSSHNLLQPVAEFAMRILPSFGTEKGNESTGAVEYRNDAFNL